MLSQVQKKKNQIWFVKSWLSEITLSEMLAKFVENQHFENSNYFALGKIKWDKC